MNLKHRCGVRFSRVLNFNKRPLYISIIATMAFLFDSAALQPFLDLAARFEPLEWSHRLTPFALFAPLLFYYFALFSLSDRDNHTSLLTKGSAFVAVVLFLRLPIFYHLPFAALTYQLALIGCFGACRLLDLFFLTKEVPVRLQRQYTLVFEEGNIRSLPL